LADDVVSISFFSPADDKLNLFRQQAVFVEKKKEEKEARLKGMCYRRENGITNWVASDIMEERNELDKEVKEKMEKQKAEGSRVTFPFHLIVTFLILLSDFKGRGIGHLCSKFEEENAVVQEIQS
jgi:hypothetical protein